MITTNELLCPTLMAESSRDLFLYLGINNAILTFFHTPAKKKCSGFFCFSNQCVYLRSAYKNTYFNSKPTCLVEFGVRFPFIIEMLTELHCLAAVFLVHWLFAHFTLPCVCNFTDRNCNFFWFFVPIVTRARPRIIKNTKTKMKI